MSTLSLYSKLEKERKYHDIPVGTRVEFLFDVNLARKGDTGIVTDAYESIGNYRCSFVRLDKNNEVTTTTNYILKEISDIPVWEI